MRIILMISLILLVAGCTCAPTETTQPLQQQNNEVADKGICGDKVCSGTESSPQSSSYCKQDCYPTS